MKINELYHGFKLMDIHTVEEIQSEAHVFMHEKSGAKLLYLKNDDDDKVFSVAFRTPPSDSTGVPHIIEHCVLSGSRKYKTKEPFMDMVKGSLKTFINAMTFSDKTIYPVASRNEKDFRNLMDVYLDSVFFPMIYEEKEIFMQEGWHHNIHDKADPITYNGVVYNEMRGSYSQPTTVLREVIGRSLFPDTTYQYSSGGNPDVIPELTYEDFLQFHRDYYQPSNAYIYVYGNGDIDSYLQHIDEDYLQHFEDQPVDSTIDVQAPFTSRTQLEESYSISVDEDEKQKTYLSYNFVIGDALNGKDHMLGEVFKEVLVNAAAGVVKKALLDAGIGQDILCSFSGGRQLYLSIIAKNAERSQSDAFKQVVESALEEVVKTGLDEDIVASAINIAEYDMREATGFATKGIIYHIQSMNSWLYDGHPTDLIAYDEDIQFMRDQIGTGYFEKQVQQKLIENSHASVVVLYPEKGLGDKKTEQVAKSLEEFKASLSPEEIEAMIAENEALKKKQLSPDSVEALATIPKLSVSDVDPKAEEIPREVIEKDDYKIIYHELFTNNIGYVEFIFDTTSIEQADIPYIALLSDLIGKLDTRSKSYGQISAEIYKETGGISTNCRTYVNGKAGTYYPKLIVSGKAVNDKLPILIDLQKELMTETVFTNDKRLKEVLLQNKSRMEMAISNRGDNYASQRVASYFSEASHYSELTKGFTYYWFVSELIDELENDIDAVQKKLSDVYQQLFKKENLIVSFTGDADNFKTFTNAYESLVHAVNQNHLPSRAYAFDLEKKNEGIAASSNVQYVAMGYNFRQLGYDYNGSMQVLRAILNSEYLHDRIRAKGGAYGCGISFADSGNVVATSYRDPRLEDTLNVFKEIADYVEDLSLDQEALTKFVIGAISRVDSAMTAKGKGMLSTANYISGITQELLQKDRDDILTTNVETLKGLAKLVRDIMVQDYYCVYGNDTKIKSSEALFNSIKQFSK